MAAPRLHIEPWEPDVLYTEAEGPDPVQAGLQGMGFDVRNRLNERVANVSVIHRNAASGELTGVADGRGSGAAAAPDR